MAGVDPLASAADEQWAIESAELFTDYLHACRADRYAMSLLPPGRFLMPGDLAGSPALTFVPLDVPPAPLLQDRSPRANWGMMRRRYNAYVDVVVRPFFREHFARLDRQIVLVDALAAFNAGPEACATCKARWTAILDCFRVGTLRTARRHVQPARGQDPVRGHQGRPSAPVGARPARGDPVADDELEPSTKAGAFPARRSM
jgi:predicted YcjX-like family ATPase